MRVHNHPMDMKLVLAEGRWEQAVDAGELGLWDLRPDLETVHHSPAWKRRLGFPDPDNADSTHFWRCRVHPDDLPLMLEAMRAHSAGHRTLYEATFRLRSNGSGYRLLHSRGRVVDRTAAGRATRMIGTMIDLTDRPPSPATGLPAGPRGIMGGSPLDLPFHLLLGMGELPGGDAGGQVQRLADERRRLLALVQDLLLASLLELDERRPGG